jgi:hypothetical protein
MTVCMYYPSIGWCVRPVPGERLILHAPRGDVVVRACVPQ